LRPSSRLDRDVELGPVPHVEEQAAVLDLQNIGAELPAARRDVPSRPAGRVVGGTTRCDAQEIFRALAADGYGPVRIDCGAAME